MPRLGDLWRLGDHHLMCGDSTDATTVTHMMGENRDALVFTSPPLGTSATTSTTAARIGAP